MKVSGSSRKLRGSLANLSRMAQASGGGFSFFLVLFLFLNVPLFFSEVVTPVRSQIIQSMRVIVLKSK